MSEPRFLEDIAKIVHAANREYCRAIGDPVQPPWDEAPEWMRESAIDGVRKVYRGEVTSPEESHTSWMAHKLMDGWKYGPVKDAAAKTHPCMVPWSHLPAEQKAKDRLFVSVVQSFL